MNEEDSNIDMEVALISEEEDKHAPLVFEE